MTERQNWAEFQRHLSRCLLFILVASAGCSKKSPQSGRIDVTVQIDQALMLDAVHMEVTGEGKPLLPKDFPATGLTTLTWTIMVQNLKSSLTATVAATGMRAGKPVVTNAGDAKVSPGFATQVFLKLTALCSPGPICTDPADTCDNGLCVKRPTFGEIADSGIGLGQMDASLPDSGDASAPDSVDQDLRPKPDGGSDAPVNTSADGPNPDASADLPVNFSADGPRPDGGSDASVNTSGDSACVASTTDPRNCGSCGHDCTTLANVSPGAAGIECRLGACYVPLTACTSGFAHCSSRADDGCETNIQDALNCGGCGKPCNTAAPVCSAGATGFGCTLGCSAPTADACNTTCVNLKSDPKNCGSCGHDCTGLLNVKPGDPAVTCQAGVCNVPASSCAAGFAHCSARPDDGCEASLADSKTCGSCTKTCTAPTPACSSTTGSPVCSANCTGTTADVCGTSCVSLKTDPKNCGTCAHDCSGLPNVKPGVTGITCQAGICSIPASACTAGFTHCTANPDDGCETDLTQPTNCGQCGKACVAPTALCSTTNNTPACSSSCIKPAPNLCGTQCVDNQSDPLNCGTCGHNCTTLLNVKAGAAGVQCRTGACYVPASACVSGFAHCSTNPDDGCETDLTGTTNCGSCGTKCTPPTGLCSTTTGAPTCSSSCVPPAPNLCTTKCVDLQSDPLNCGSCGHACGTLPHVKAGAPVQCVAGVCQVPASSCAAGFGHCTSGGDVACETALNACGGCGSLAGAPGATCNACGNYVCSADKASVSCVGTPGTPISCSANAPQTCSATGTLNTGTACSGGTPTCSGGTCICGAGKTEYCGNTMCCSPPVANSNTSISCAAGTSCLIQCNPSFHACGGLTSPCYGNADTLHCGSNCLDCTQPNATAICGGTQCANTCNGFTFTQCGTTNGKPLCGSWNFDSGSANNEGWTLGAPLAGDQQAASGLTIVQSPSGSLAAKVHYVDTGNLEELFLQFNTCAAGVDLRGRKLRFSVYLSGSNTLYFSDGYDISVFEASGANCGGVGVDAPVPIPVQLWTQVTSSTFDTIGFAQCTGINPNPQIVNSFSIHIKLDQPWTGDIYFDDIQIL